MIRDSVRVGAAVMAVALIAGCTVGPNYVRPSVEAPAAYKEAQVDGTGTVWKRAAPRDDIDRGNWWEIFGDRQLNVLAAQVEVSHQNVLQAEAQYRQAVALVRAARAAYFPTVTLDPSVTRSQQSRNGAVTGAGERATLYSVPLSASWEIDLWGRVRRSVESSEASAQASAGDLANMRLSMQSELVADYFQLRANDVQRKLVDETVAAYAKSLELTRLQLSQGAVGQANVDQAETQLKSTQAQAIDLGIQRAQLEHAIVVLIGKPPAELSVPVAAELAPPPLIPFTLPSELLERRPDIAGAERRVAAANAQIGVAEAAYFPSLGLSASGGFESAVLSSPRCCRASSTLRACSGPSARCSRRRSSMGACGVRRPSRPAQAPTRPSPATARPCSRRSRTSRTTSPRCASSRTRPRLKAMPCAPRGIRLR